VKSIWFFPLQKESSDLKADSGGNCQQEQLLLMPRWTQYVKSLWRLEKLHGDPRLANTPRVRTQVKD